MPNYRRLSVVFLDIDGVLLPVPPSGEVASVSAEAVKHLNLVTNIASAVIVVSSNRRIGSSVAELATQLGGWGVQAEIFDKIPDGNPDRTYADRGREIEDWVAVTNATDDRAIWVEKFVIIDDDRTDLEPWARSLVSPKPDVGLAFHDALDALRVLASPW